MKYDCDNFNTIFWIGIIVVQFLFIVLGMMGRFTSWFMVFISFMSVIFTYTVFFIAVVIYDFIKSRNNR